MTDHFEKAKDRILLEAKANGGVTPDHLLDALIATNEDLDEKLGEQKELLNEHIKDDKARAENVEEDLQAWQQKQAERCAAEHEKLFGRQPRRYGDPLSSDYGPNHMETADEAQTSREAIQSGDRRVWVMWGIGLFLAITAAHEIISFGLERLLGK